MPLPRLLRPVLALLLALSCAACAEGDVGRAATPDRYESDDPAERERVTAPPTAEPSEPALTAQAAAAAASQVLLVPEDLPGSTASPADAEAAEYLAGAWRTYRACAGADAERLAEAPSDLLGRNEGDAGELATATTAVLADREALESVVGAYRSDEARECGRDLATDAVLRLAGRDASLGPSDVAAVRPHVPSEAESFGHRVTTTVTGGERTFPAVVDVVGVAVGRTEVLVLLIAFDRELSVQERDALLARVAERARGAS